MTPDIHDAANIFPLDDESLPALADDIKANGQRVPIELLGGKVIDGRRRLKACRMAGVNPTFKDVQVDDPVAYVVSLNLHRRHLDVGQRAMVGARVLEIYQKAAKERMSEGGKEAGRGRAKQGSRNNGTPIDRAAPAAKGFGRASDVAGSAVGVSGDSVEKAARILESGVPELVKAVDSGEVSVSRASRIAEKPEAEQREEVANVTAEVKEKPAAKKEEPQPVKPPGELQGKGVFLANEALNCLIRIPKNDPLRKRGLQIVTDWIRRNP